MEVTNLLDIHTREELYAWYLEHHATANSSPDGATSAAWRIAILSNNF